MFRMSDATRRRSSHHETEWRRMKKFESSEPDEEWDDDFARDLIGCTLLVGLTYVDHDGTVMRRTQVFGVVQTVDRGAGVVIRQSNGEDYSLPPALEAFQAAAPGTYRLSATNEIVHDPDFLAMFTVQSPLRS